MVFTEGSAIWSAIFEMGVLCEKLEHLCTNLRAYAQNKPTMHELKTL